jgi:Uma2 family endonuclease
LIRVTPHTVIEVISKRPRDARRDRVEKLRDYWIVDPGVRTFEVLELSQKRYAHALDATSGQKRIRGYAGLVVDLDALWAARRRRR